MLLAGVSIGDPRKSHSGGSGAFINKKFACLFKTSCSKINGQMDIVRFCLFQAKMIEGERVN